MNHTLSVTTGEFRLTIRNRRDTFSKRIYYTIELCFAKDGRVQPVHNFGRYPASDLRQRGQAEGRAIARLKEIRESPLLQVFYQLRLEHGLPPLEED